MFARGNSSYPLFCGFGTWLDSELHELSGRRVLKIGYGDELGDRDGEYNKWSHLAYKYACLEANLPLPGETATTTRTSQHVLTKWVPIEGKTVSHASPDSEVVAQGIYFATQ